MKIKQAVIVSILALAASTAAYSQQLFDKVTMTVMAVSNIAQAKKFYTEDLGFKVEKDYSSRGYRWVTVVPPGDGPSITLSTYFGNLKPGTMQLYLSTRDIRAAYKELRANGVGVQAIQNDLFGPGSGVKWFRLEDPDRNHWLVWQEPKR